MIVDDYRNLIQANPGFPRTLDLNVVLSWLRNHVWPVKIKNYFSSHTFQRALEYLNVVLCWLGNQVWKYINCKELLLRYQSTWTTPWTPQHICNQGCGFHLILDKDHIGMANHRLPICLWKLWPIYLTWSNNIHKSTYNVNLYGKLLFAVTDYLGKYLSKQLVGSDNILYSLFSHSQFNDNGWKFFGGKLFLPLKVLL